jgi:hypothetical protein
VTSHALDQKSTSEFGQERTLAARVYIVNNWAWRRVSMEVDMYSAGRRIVDDLLTS